MDKKDITRYLSNWQNEIDGAALYYALAEAETQTQLAEVYRRLAGSEEKHARVWEKRLEDAGAKIPPRKPSWRARTMRFLAKRFGPSFVLPTVANHEKADSRAYDGQPEAETGALSEFRSLFLETTRNEYPPRRIPGPCGGRAAARPYQYCEGGGNPLRGRCCSVEQKRNNSFSRKK